MTDRVLRYTLAKEDGVMTVKDVLRGRLGLSRQEISHAKYAQDGLMVRSGRPDFVNRFRRRAPLEDDISAEHSVSAEYRASVNNMYPEGAAFVRVTSDTEVAEGDTVQITLHEIHEDMGKIVPKEGALRLLYEDADLAVLDKPAGVVSHPCPGHFADSLANRLAWHFRAEGCFHPVRVIGRLDKDTSGVILYAKSRMAARALSAPNAREKEYLALCGGCFGEEEREGSIRAPIRKIPGKKLLREVHPEGDAALTHYRVLVQYEGYAALSLQIETGRTHQIRVHMAHAGHALLGDPLYAPPGQARRGMARTALHAHRLVITHPVTGERMIFTAPLPGDMAVLHPATIPYNQA